MYFPPQPTAAGSAARCDRPLRPDCRWFNKPVAHWHQLPPGRWRGLPSLRRPLRTARHPSLSLSRLFALIAQRPAGDDGDDEESDRPGP